MWCVPILDEAYRDNLFDVISLYERPYDAKLPVVCLDEKSVELRSSKRKGRKTKRAKYTDYEYARHGTANVFVMTEPKGGRHYMRVTENRKRPEFAKTLKFLAGLYPDAVTIHLVMDNLNTHDEKSLIQHYGEQEGRRLWARFTVHYTPKHGSWLNQAEIAICVMSRAVLNRARLSSTVALRERLLKFFQKLRQKRWRIEWGFTTQKAQSWVKDNVGQH